MARRWLGNSAANLVGGLSAAAFNLLMPAILLRYLPPDQFSAWSLALQVVTYVNLLGLGLQTATARAIAQSEGRNDEGGMRKIIRAAHSIAVGATIAAMVAVLLLVVTYPLLFPSIPSELLPTFRAVLLLIGLSTATQLLALVPMGVFQGVHRNIVFVATQVVIRVVTVILVWAGVRSGLQLLGIATTVALCALTLYPVIRKLMHRLLAWAIDAQEIVVDRPLRIELLNYCASLSVWSVSTLLVNSVGIVMVGRVAFEKTGVYSLAMAAATVLAGLLGAIFSPLVTAAAALHAQPSRRAELPALLIKSTQICAVCLYLMFAAVLLLHRQVIELWVGASFVDSLAPLLLILVGAHALRNLCTPYAMILLATGMHRRALMTGVAEGLSNLVATIVLGQWFGLVGIACGTLVGALTGVACALILNTSSTPELTPRPGSFVLKAFVAPLAIFLPIIGLIFHLKALL